MFRDYELFLDDIIEAIDKIIRYTEGMSFKEFVSDDKSLDAVIRNLEIIGEAAKQIPPNVKKESPEIEWKKLVTIRNILIHEYFGVNRKVIWDFIIKKLKPLRKKCVTLKEKL